MPTTQLLPPIRKALLKDILSQLGIARDSITELLEHATSIDTVRRLTRQRAEIARVLSVFQQSATDALVAGAGDAWSGGITSILDQLGEGALAPRIDIRALLAVEHYLTHKIADITRTAQQSINTALTQQILGVRSMSDTITDIEDIMDGAPRWRAMTVAYTEIGRVYSASQYETMLSQAKVLPGLTKQWIASGKAHARPGHIMIAQQTAEQPIPVDQPFDVPDPVSGETEQLRYPRDPNASARNTINCGCMMVAVAPDADSIAAG